MIDIEIAMLALLVAMVIILIRAFWGTSLFDRILAGNTFGSHVIVLVVLVGQLFDTEFFLDIAITYALINFIATLGLLRFLKFTEAKEK
jgi:multicomponent Na+:H+ antiporter subunit F